MKQLLKYLLWFLFVGALISTWGQEPSLESLALSTDASAGQRFVAVHGQRAALMGYSEQGLEAWAYPFQILSNYRIGFQPQGATSESDGRLLLRRVIYRPDSITRTYIGPDYIVKEKLFVPIDQPAAIITYEVNSPQPTDIVVHFTPVLNLMWPGALGGQSTAWNSAASGYVISEPLHGNSAVIASPQIVANDQIANTTLHTDNTLALTLRPERTSDSAAATLYIALNPQGTSNAAATVKSLSESLQNLEVQSQTHYADLEQSSLQIHTPDEKVNQALAWANIALDQAWVCNSKIGCGIVAGYGPSRNERRPQYDWFFAGDGLVAVNGLLATAQYSRARDELEFITKYQDKRTGMIWHEISQSAGYIDWSKYPYMFVHVDISFDYLAVVARYVSITGDTAFAREHWDSIAAAYIYCRSIIHPQDHLPHIPADKEGANEQERPEDDLELSSEWVAATAGFADLADQTGHPQEAAEARESNRLARAAIAANYWDAAHHFWIDGHTTSGKAIFTRRSGFYSSILQGVFSPEQNEEILDQLASAQFQTDWGTRSVAADSSIYNPYSYAMGSVSALNSASAAMAFWKMHRPDTAFSIWSGLMPWNSLDSLGHLHEVLAGNFYHPQLESVPEQTWSSAGLLDSAIRGLFGLEIDGLHNSITFTPHLPAQWAEASMKHIATSRGLLDISLHQDDKNTRLEVINHGQPIKLIYEPRIPLGARLLNCDIDGRHVNCDTRGFSAEEQVHLDAEIPSGTSHYSVRFVGGVSLTLPKASLQLGDQSSQIKITNIKWADDNLHINADIPLHTASTLQLITPLSINKVSGASVFSISTDRYKVSLKPSTKLKERAGYTSSQLQITVRNDFKRDRHR
jgi:glycogen debranching enzyme